MMNVLAGLFDAWQCGLGDGVRVGRGPVRLHQRA